MSAGYILDSNNNKIQAFSEQEVLAVLQQAIDNQSLEGIDSTTAYVSLIKCCDSDTTHKLAWVTQARYNELEEAGQLDPQAWYFILDDTFRASVNASLTQLQQNIDNLPAILSGENVPDITMGRAGDIYVKY